MAENQFKYFVLLADMRTGSNLFETRINDYPKLSCHGELFNPKFVGYPYKDAIVQMGLSAREQDPFLLLFKLIEAVTDTLPGFRLFSDHDPRVQAFCLEDPECAKIVLTRNPLDAYVSQCIAIETDQWKMGDLHRRRSAKVMFQIEDFKAYLNTRKVNQKEIKQTLQKGGQTAFYLDYADLNNLDAMNGLAAYLGDETRLKKLSQKMARQNPESLSEKVKNYDQMMDQVRQLDIFEPEIEPYLEPHLGLDTKACVLCKGLPILFCPVGEVGTGQIAGWMAAHGGSLATSGHKKPELNDWLKETPERVVLTLLDHPLDRAYNAFYKHIFCVGQDGFPWIRDNLIKHYDVVLPKDDLAISPTLAELRASGYDTKEHQQAFEGFLKYLKGNLNGQTRARIDRSWATQFSILSGYSDWVQPDYVIRPDRMADTLRFVEQTLELNPIQAKPTAPDHAITLCEIYSSKLEKLCRAAYAIDYNRFGFKDWD